MSATARLQMICATGPEELEAKLLSRTARIGIIGLGYVGLPLALLYSEEKFSITGFDIDLKKVNALNKGDSYIFRILPDEIQSAQQSGFAATSDFSQLRSMDAVIICVPTPLNEYHEPDLSYIVETAKCITPHLRPGQLIVLESTTYPGTTEEVLIPILEKSGYKAARGEFVGEDEFLVAFSPEREDPGNDTVARRDSKGDWWTELCCNEWCSCDVRHRFQEHSSSIESRGCRDDEAARKHLPLRQHRASERTQVVEPADGYRHLGGDRGGKNKAVRVPSFLSGSWPWRALHPH